jgi:hypothetical protein
MATYVPFPAEQSLPPPGKLADTRYFYFFLNADPAKTQGLVNRYFNDRMGERRYHASNLVLLTFSHVHELTSADPATGSICYKDIAFWMPIWKSEGAVLASPPDCLFPPYIFVDNMATMATGREVFGLPKQPGRFRMPEKLAELEKDPDSELTLEVVGSIAEGGLNDWRKLATVQREERGTALGRSTDFLAPFRLLDALRGVPTAARGIALPEWLGGTRALGLKQFRDAAHPDQACYQSIVEAPLVAENTRETVQLTDRWRVKFEDLDSHPVMETFGFAEEVVAETAVYLRADMALRTGQEVWRAR